MKNLFFSGAATLIAAALTIVSCNKEPVAVHDNGQQDKQLYELNVKIGGGQTKAVDLASTTDEAKINDIQIFVFDSSNNIETYANADTESDLNKIYVTSGAKHIYAVINANSMDDAATVSDLNARITLLEDNEKDNMLMAGSKDVTVSGNQSIEIEVYRLVSRIDIQKITTSFTSPALSLLTFNVDSIYVVNVVNECAVSRTFIANRTYSYINKSRFKTSNADELLLDSSCGISFDGNDSKTLTDKFYVYPNNSTADVSDATWSPRVTRLVVSARLDGKRMYYPVNITVDQPNKKYIIEELIITRPGSDSPDKPVSTYECSFKIKVKDWASFESHTETI